MPRRLTRARLRNAASRVRAGFRVRARHLILAINPSAFSGRTGSPADFATWVERNAGRRTPGFPDAWRTRPDVPLDSPARVAVVVHVFFPELLEEILEQLSAIPVTFDLLVTNASATSLRVERDRLTRAAHVVILDVPNHGRDILPLVQLVNAGFLDPYQIVLKVHTKRSHWRRDHPDLAGSGEEWRTELLDALLGDVENVATILEAFATSSELGLVTAAGSVLGPEFWGDNQSTSANILRRLELELEPNRLAFAAGSMYWARAFVLQGLRALNLSADDFEPEMGQVNATTAHALERVVGIVTREAGLTIRVRPELPSMSGTAEPWSRFEVGGPQLRRIRAVPFYLPQFHPIPENDRWWGRGFTEWTNVTRARPVYFGHHQPKLPTETGFYDLRLAVAVEMQASLAEEAGVDGFMYYHYWFAGRQLLDGPIRARLDEDLQLPFCVMWANENWTRRWDGRDSDVLVGQRYEDVPTGQFLDDVLPILRDPRYMRIGDRAIVAVYRPGQIPDLPRVIAAWRESARRGGVGELYVLNVDVATEFHGLSELGGTGLDGSLGFPPHNSRWEWVPHQHVGAAATLRGNILSYRALVDHAIAMFGAGLADTYFPGVMVTFDNTARRQATPDIWYGANPYTFRRWLAAAATAVADREPDRRLVFINAWNEWAEGAVLEPTDRFGATFLQGVRDVVLG